MPASSNGPQHNKKYEQQNKKNKTTALEERKKMLLLQVQKFVCWLFHMAAGLLYGWLV